MRLIHFKAKRHHKKARHNPKHRSHKRRHYRRNPVSLKKILSPSVAISALALAGGFIAGNKIGGMVFAKLPASMRRFAGLLSLIGGGFLASKAKNQHAKSAIAGLTASGAYDLLAMNVPQLKIAALSGETIDVSGNVQLVGDSQSVYAGDSQSVYAGETIDVSGDMTELVGDDGDDSVYG